MENRRSVPAKVMTGPGPNRDEIDTILHIAARVPDHGKIAPWRFIEFSEAAKIRLGQEILARALEINPDLNGEQCSMESTRFSRSVVVIALVSAPKNHPKVPEWEQLLSAGAVGMNMLIAANALGYDAQWLTEWYAYDVKLAPNFGLNEGERIAGFFHFGTKTMPKTERERPVLSQIYTIME